MSLPRYPEYRDSGVEWLGAVPAHWAVKRFKWLIERNDGGVWGDDPDGNGDTIVLRSTDQTVDGQWRLDEPASRKLWESERRGATLEIGDLLVTKSSGSALHIGKTTLVDEQVAKLGACYSNFMQRLRLNDEFLPKLAWYVMNNELARRQFDLASNSTTGLANLNGTMISEILMPVPSALEQAVITAFLDRETAKIDGLIAEQEKLIALLAEKRQATISHAVTRGLNPDAPMKDSGVRWLGEMPAHWTTTRLKYAAEAVVDCPHETPVYDDEGSYRVIRTADVSEGRLHAETMYSVSQIEYLQRIRRMSLERGDIVYGREGERWGFAAQVPESGVFCLGQRMMQFRATTDTHPRFLMWQMNAQSTYRQGETDTVGATSPHVNVATIKNYILSKPPVAEQRQISDFLDIETTKLDSLDFEARSAISLLGERRSALIAAAVTGQIDVRSAVPTCEEA